MRQETGDVGQETGDKRLVTRDWYVVHSVKQFWANIFEIYGSVAEFFNVRIFSL